MHTGSRLGAMDMPSSYRRDNALCGLCGFMLLACSFCMNYMTLERRTECVPSHACVDVSG